MTSTIVVRPGTVTRRGVLLAYGLAALFGLAIALRIFPPAAINGSLSLVHPAVGDTAQHIVGQRYFLADHWRWPPLDTGLIDAPAGVDIALTDSIPLAGLLGRLFAWLLPRGGHLVYAWVALCFVLQPVAAVFALRSAGVGGALALVSGSILAACMPAMVFRFNHAALCAHFVLLLAIGLYFRMVRPGGHRWAAASAVLMIAALLIHPYLMAMVTGLLLAAPLTLLARRELRAATRVALRLALGLLLLAVTAAVGGYLGTGQAAGFGLLLVQPAVTVHSHRVRDHPRLHDDGRDRRAVRRL